MSKKTLPIVELTLDKIVGGGQALGSLMDGKKAFIWGGLPGERVKAQLNKKKLGYDEGVVIDVIEASTDRVLPVDSESYLSTSPWQIMRFKQEQHYKAALIEEAFELHSIVLPEKIDVYTDARAYGYRNKIEFSWWWSPETEQLDLAFFRRGTHGRLPVEGTSLAAPAINKAALAVRDMLRRRSIQAFPLKTLLIRSDQSGRAVAQLYVKDEAFEPLSRAELQSLPVIGFELIFSNPKSPASVITTRLQSWGELTLTDNILDVPFTYAVEGFFQINLPIYEQALRDMQTWVQHDKPTIDLYSGVGTIGLTIASGAVTMVEINEQAVKELRRNITALRRRDSAVAILAASENILEYITSDVTIIVDPPRAGLHTAVTDKLREARPKRIIYLSCNPVTQARDVAQLADTYGIRHHRGYNFFPRTPHIEHLVVLELLP